MRWRRIGPLLAVMVAVVVAVAVATAGLGRSAELVKRYVDDESCATVEVTRGPDARPAFAVRWRRAVETVFVSCEHLGDAALYARFPSARDARSALSLSPPLTRTCEYASTEYEMTVEGDPMTSPAEAYRRRCARRHGELQESTYRYCLAGPEVVVGTFGRPSRLGELCRELGGHLFKPRRGALLL